ncbi:hypothetical protein TTHERM_00923180 (macronuclear) [Tetrahymena thermophila SB210]|uniref:Transmembrane protein n=1 Tax=Tetrahymena thermophila (strain SB210) TaxID=312017 RepID=Q23WM7_TETTS|nr:hypothetical protein TTHERM_00923180 [Tetrahymena thermophila SB210]EAS00953.1 hypothetical protein TTHERM_00923180 [Tetrahymena thermophila SB210]|eukprot:XP_001021198.1 hypothetical protein TTHERM_00923180 [Tetrahymena thermophila SB210]
MNKLILIGIYLYLNIFTISAQFDGARTVLSLDLLNKVKDETYDELFSNQKLSFIIQPYELNGLARLTDTIVDISIRKEDIQVQGDKNQLGLLVQRADIQLSANLNVASFSQSLRISPSCSFYLLFSFYKNEGNQLLLEKIDIEEFYLSEEGISLPFYFKSSKQYITKLLQLEIKNYLQSHYITRIVDNINQKLIEINSIVVIPNTHVKTQMNFQIPVINKSLLALETNFQFSGDQNLINKSQPQQQSKLFEQIALFENFQSDFTLQISQICIQNLMESLFYHKDLNQEVKLSLSYQNQKILNLNLFFLGISNHLFEDQQIIVSITSTSPPKINLIKNSHIQLFSEQLIDFKVNLEGHDISLFKLKTNINLKISLKLDKKNNISFALEDFKFEDFQFFVNEKEKSSIKIIQPIIEYELGNILKNKLSNQQIIVSNQFFNLQNAQLQVNEDQIQVQGNISFQKIAQM